MTSSGLLADEGKGSDRGEMRAVQVARAGGPFELVEREVPEPAAGQVRIRVEACGICHADAMVKAGAFPGLAFPRVPGHEIAGRVHALGAGVTAWKPGDRVGVGWHGGHRVRPWIEVFPLERAEQALTKMLQNRVRFRAVLVP
jgi:D-arabinose 1-dehydrogenase-like Zn-dependent alcohol dehydrogenase